MYQIGKYEIHNWVTDHADTFRSVVIKTGKSSSDRIYYRISVRSESWDSLDGKECSGYVIWWGPFREFAEKIYPEQLLTFEQAKQRVDEFLNKFKTLKSFF